MARSRGLVCPRIFTSGRGEGKNRAARIWVDTEGGRRKRTVHLGMCSSVSRKNALERVQEIAKERARLERFSLTAKTAGSTTVDRYARGGYAEYVAGIDLMRRGFEVFRSMNHFSSCDLVAMKDGNVFRVEVKFLGSMRKLPATRTISQVGKFDAVAVVSADDSVYYINGAGRRLEDSLNLAIATQVSGVVRNSDRGSAEKEASK